MAQTIESYPGINQIVFAVGIEQPRLVNEKTQMRRKFNKGLLINDVKQVGRGAKVASPKI